MFDFEKLEVYKKSKDSNIAILKLLKENRNIDPVLRDQMKRASISIVLNIAEGVENFPNLTEDIFIQQQEVLFMNVINSQK